MIEEGIEFRGVEFKFYNSGHVAEGKSVLINSNVRIFYTGDFCTSIRIILDPLPYIKRLYKNLIKKVIYYVNAIGYAVIGARSLGTVQEIIALLSNTKRKFNLYVDPRVYKMSRIHFDYDYVHAEFERCQSFKPCIKEKVYITGVENALKLRREGYDVIICTGLSATWNDFNSFTLSVHEDKRFNKLRHTIQSRESIYRLRL